METQVTLKLADKLNSIMQFHFSFLNFILKISMYKSNSLLTSMMNISYNLIERYFAIFNHHSRKYKILKYYVIGGTVVTTTVHEGEMIWDDGNRNECNETDILWLIREIGLLLGWKPKRIIHYNIFWNKTNIR